MGVFDRIKKNKNQGDDDLDELDMDLDGDEYGEETPNASSGGALGRAMGFMKKAKNRISDGEGDEDEDDEDNMGGGIGGLLGKVKKSDGRKQKPRELTVDDDDDALDESNELETDQDDDDGEEPVRRSGIAAALDGDSAAAENPDEEDAAPADAGGLGLDLESLFEVEYVANPVLKDLANFVDDVSAVELAADLRTFLEDLR